MKTIKLFLSFLILSSATQVFSHPLISVKEDNQTSNGTDTESVVEVSESKLHRNTVIIDKSDLLVTSSKTQTPIIENTNICITVGSTSSISVSNPGTSATYIWQIKTPTVDWTTITSSNAGTVYTTYDSATLNIKKTSILPVSGTLYRVIVNDGVSGDLISNEASITVNPLAVAKTISGATEVCAGGNNTLLYGIGSVGAIQWQYSTTSATEDFLNIDGATELSHTTMDLYDNTWFRVMNTSGACLPVYSPAVKVIVNQVPSAGYIVGGDINVCKSSNSTELVLYNYEGSITWQKASDSGGSPGTFSTIFNATSSTYTAINLTATTYFRAVVSNGVCPPDTSEAVVINIDPTPVSKTISGANPICKGEIITLTYGTGSVGTIQWQSSTTSGTADFDDIVGATSETFQATDLYETTWFRVVNTSGKCAPAYSQAVKVTVYPKPDAGYIVGGNTNVCKSSNSTELVLYNYEGDISWQRASDIDGSPGTFSTIPNITSDTYIANNLTETTYFRAVVSSGVCPSITTEVVVVNVDPTPISKSISGAQALCAGENITLTYGTGSVGTIQWQYSTTSGTGDFINIDGENELTYTATELNETTWFRVMNSSGECTSTYSPAVKITVSPEPNAGYIVGGDTTVCKTSNTTPLALYDYVGDIKWQKALDIDGSPGTFTTIPNAISAVYQAKSLTETTYFRALVSSGVCPSVTSDIVVIYVDPTPIAKTISGASPVCVGGSKVLTYGTGSVGDMQWQYSITSGTADFTDIDFETDINYIINDLQETIWYRVMNTSGECGSVYSQAVKVITNPLPVVGQINGGDVYVSKKSNKTVLTLTDYSGTIQWQKASSPTGPFEDIPSSNSSSYTAQGLSSTTYFRVLVSGECSSISSKPTAINVENEFDVMTFPNPFDSEFKIITTTVSNEQIEMKVYDMMGRIIESRQLQQSDRVELGNNFPSGIYNILVTQGAQEKTLRVIKR